MTQRLFLTGGNGDIGKAIADKFSASGFEVVAPGSAQLNLEDPSAIKDFLEAGEAFDVFVHCAGFNQPKPLQDITRQDLQKTVSINAYSFYDIVRDLITHHKIKKPGYILGISSIYGEFARRGRFSYAASKHCLNGMIKTAALELGVYDIKVNGLAPGFIDTKMTRKNNDASVIASFERKTALGRLGKPSEIAEIAYFLCSKNNNYIHGQIIVADGGYSIGGFQE